MTLSLRQKREIVEKGYLKLPGAVAPEKVAAALRSANILLCGRQKTPLNPQRVQFFSQIDRSPEIMGLLFDTTLWPACEELIGEGRLKRPKSAQVALGFPTVDESVVFNGKESHIDGFPKGRRIQTFTLCVCVLLSDVPGEFQGNFKVFPGTHALSADYLRRHGYRRVNQDLAGRQYPAVERITGKAGDAVICHYNLIHAREWNSSPNIRYAVFFRLERLDHRSRWKKALTDLWLEWDGIRDHGIDLKAKELV